METILFACPHCKSVNRLPKKEEYRKARCGVCGEDLLKNRPIEIEHPSQFAEIVSKVSVPVVVDFWAQWCGPCKMFAPTFANVAARYPLKVNFLKVDVDRPELNPLAAQLNIRSIPTIVGFKNGVEVDRLMGAVPELQFALWVDQLVEG